jgi:phosphate transport system protein
MRRRRSAGGASPCSPTRREPRARAAPARGQARRSLEAVTAVMHPAGGSSAMIAPGAARGLREPGRRTRMETADLSHHISRRFNEDLERVRSKVLGMGGFVEQQLHKAITALVEGDSSLGESVAQDDHQVNNMEIAIDEECSRILATRAPAAGDLRVIVAIIKTITDLERIGDEGEKIGYIASRLATMERPADKYREIKHLGRVVSEMVHDALDAFARMDVESALRVARQDRLVDEEYEAIQRQSITFMMEDPRTIRRALDVMWVVRALERIGDHAKNISEYVIYMVHGKDIRHTSLDDVERELRGGTAAAGLPPPSA